ncbi:MAG: phage tail protein [Candidatus Shapirobacteria bacterium]|jgi:microcystin-dependent protein
MLRAIIGVTYGAEPSVGADTKFALPILGAPVPGTGYYICHNGRYPIQASDEDTQISNDYVGAISRLGGSYNPPGTYYSDGSSIDYFGSDTRLAVALGPEFQYTDNLYNLPDLTAGISIDEKKDVARKSYIAYYGVMPASEYYDYSGSFFCGMIKLMAGDILPLGWRVCDGAELQVSDYSCLYDTMTYGSTPPSVKPKTFNLPNISAPIKGTRYIINTTGEWPFCQI